MKRDPYQHKERWEKWKEEVKANGGIPEISKANSDSILAFLKDMEEGKNVGKGSGKGGRAYNRLNDLRSKGIFFAKKFEERFNIDHIFKLTEDQQFTFIHEMETGVIKNSRGEVYRGVSTFARDLKCIWNWHMKVNRKNGIIIPNIVEDLSSRPKVKPKWVYLTEDELKKLVSMCKFVYQVLIMFLFDTGIRAPTELLNIRVSDFSMDFKELHIRDEIVKRGSFGRTIYLKKCSDMVKEYVKVNQLKPEDYLFNICPASANKYLQRKAKSLFGESTTKGGESYSKLSLYDFRHISCCYWIKIYKKDREIMHRFGWKQSDKVYYYSEFVGMQDPIKDEDMIIGADKTELERKVNKAESENAILKEQLSSIQKDLQEFKLLAKNMISRGNFIAENLTQKNNPEIQNSE